MMHLLLLRLSRVLDPVATLDYVGLERYWARTTVEL
jgi:hypothetical protein